MADPVKRPPVESVLDRRTERFIGEAWADPKSPSAIRDRLVTHREPCPVCGHPTGDCH